MSRDRHDFVLTGRMLWTFFDEERKNLGNKKLCIWTEQHPAEQDLFNRAARRVSKFVRYSCKPGDSAETFIDQEIGD